MWYKFCQNKNKYYHASLHLFKPGDHILPGFPKPNFNYGEGIMPNHNVVFLTTDPKPHYTIADRANKDGWYIYEVEPTGKLYF